LDAGYDRRRSSNSEKSQKKAISGKIEKFETKRTVKSNEPFLLRSLAATFFPELAEGLSKDTKVFFGGVQCPFPESRAVSSNK
jgi:hypothetical protein